MEEVKLVKAGIIAIKRKKPGIIRKAFRSMKEMLTTRQKIEGLINIDGVVSPKTENKNT